MARRSGLTEKQIADRYASGFGAGEFSEYRPWIDHHDLSSLGLASRVPSRKTGRLHHLFSQIETTAFLEFIRMPEVCDVREQYPLDREVTRAIALEMGVAHPVYPNGVDTVMTTDLVVCVAESDQIIFFARSGKPASELENERVLELLEIERRYWEFKGVHWSLVTDVDRSEACRRNLEWMHGMEELDDGTAHPAYWSDRIDAFLKLFAKQKDQSFEELEDSLVARGVMQRGEIINVIRHLCWTTELQFDLEQTFDLSWPVKALKWRTAPAQKARSVA
jgi:hypothetical protein